MFNGLYISASGALTSMYRQDLLSNNLANINTVGFKPDLAAVRQRAVVREEDGLQHQPSDELLEQLGAGVQLMPNRISFAQGTLESTGNDLDFALEGDGFFVVQAASTEFGDRLRLTRDGRFAVSDNGELVNANGLPVIGTNGRPIRIDPAAGKLTVQPDGSIQQGGEIVGRFQITDIANRNALTKAGEGMFAAPPQAFEDAPQAAARVRQGWLEKAAVSDISALMRIQNASGDARANMGLLSHYDRMLDRAINTFARTG
ncbi:MAG: flagellar hook basal-body protein [Planctomycetota bacterium]